jgi:hypothetical protein
MPQPEHTDDSTKPAAFQEKSRQGGETLGRVSKLAEAVRHLGSGREVVRKWAMRIAPLARAVCLVCKVGPALRIGSFVLGTAGQVSRRQWLDRFRKLIAPALRQLGRHAAQWSAHALRFAKARPWLAASVAGCLSILALIVAVQPQRMAENAMVGALDFDGDGGTPLSGRSWVEPPLPSAPTIVDASSSSADSTVFFDSSKRFPQPRILAEALPASSEIDRVESLAEETNNGDARGARLVGTIETIDAPPARTVLAPAGTWPR